MAHATERERERLNRTLKMSASDLSHINLNWYIEVEEFSFNAVHSLVPLSQYSHDKYNHHCAKTSISLY